MDIEAHSLRPILARLGAGATLSEAEAESAFAAVMDGAATPAQIGGLLMALRARGETEDELAGAVRAMRARMLAVDLGEDAIDVCGTGGDQAGTLNISTAVTFVVAGAGVRVAKHGNRSASSRSGAADVLLALGVRLDPPLERLPAIMAAANCVFLFAPRHHAALRHAALPRAELGTRTIFNLLGPLANPAGVRRQLTGLFDFAWAHACAAVLARLGTEKSMFVHGGGLDELSLAGPSDILIQNGETILSTVVCPEDFGLAPAPIADIVGGDAAENAACLRDLLENRTPAPHLSARRARAYRDTVLLNAAAALALAHETGDMAAAFTKARASLFDGAALAAFDRLRAAAETE